MKATGIVRRIDDLGRVVIPKEIRRTLRIREGEPMEIFTGREGEIVLKKYSPIEELGNLAKEYVQAMAQTLGCLVCVSDHDQIVAASGPGQGEYQGKNISVELEAVIDNRKLSGYNKYIPVLEGDRESSGSQVICPVICAGDAIGAVIIMEKKEGIQMGETERKIAQIGAGFLGRQMEN